MSYSLIWVLYDTASGDDQRKRQHDTAETTGMPVAKKPKNSCLEEADDIVCIDWTAVILDVE